MPKAIRFDQPINCFFIRWLGQVHVEDMITYLREIVRHTEFRSGINALHDCRDAVVEQSQEDLDAIARRYTEVRPAFGDGKVAALVRSDLSFDAARLFLTLADLKPRLMGVYRDYEPARAWLGLPADYVDPFEASEDSAEQR